MEMPVPRGYDGVEHDDGTVHAISLDDLHDDRPLWREPPVCGRATGVSGDEGGHAALHRRVITCWECASLLDIGAGEPSYPGAGDSSYGPLADS